MGFFLHKQWPISSENVNSMKYNNQDILFVMSPSLVVVRYCNGHIKKNNYPELIISTPQYF